MDRRRFILSACAVLYTTSLAGCGTDNEADDEVSGDTDDSTDANGNDTTTEDASGGDEVTDTNEAVITTEDAGGNEVTDTNEAVLTTKDVGGNKGVKIVDHSVYVGGMSYGVRGIVANTGDSEVFYVDVEVEFFDAEGTTIGQESASTSDLAAGQEWEFEIRSVGNDMSEVSEIDDYDIEVEDVIL